MAVVSRPYGVSATGSTPEPLTVTADSPGDDGVGLVIGPHHGPGRADQDRLVGEVGQGLGSG